MAKKKVNYADLLALELDGLSYDEEAGARAILRFLDKVITNAYIPEAQRKESLERFKGFSGAEARGRVLALRKIHRLIMEK